MATFKFAPNIPVAADVKYLDIVPGEHGCQVRLKGKIDGSDAIAYLPGKLPDTLTALIAGGVIASKDYPLEVEKAFEIKPLKRQFSMMKDQPAGEKYGTFKIVNGNGNGAASAGSPPATAGAAGAVTPLTEEELRTAKGKHAHALKDAVTYVLDKIHPLYVAKKITLTGDEAYKHAFTLYKSWEERGLVQ